MTKDDVIRISYSYVFVYINDIYLQLKSILKRKDTANSFRCDSEVHVKMVKDTRKIFAKLHYCVSFFNLYNPGPANSNVNVDDGAIEEDEDDNE